MRNRAKCKLCQSIIESTTLYEEIGCACGHISVSGGDKYGCSAIDWSNFLRVDDQGNEIIPTIRDADKPKTVTRKELLDMLDDLIKRIEDMPQNALIVAINHYDYLSLLILLSSIFRSDNKADLN